MKIVELVKGKRYPIEIVAAGHGSAGAGSGMEARVEHARCRADRGRREGRRARRRRRADLGPARAEESPVEVPGFKGGDKTTLDLPADQIALLEAGKGAPASRCGGGDERQP